jgi:hypothetical protein
MAPGMQWALGMRTPHLHLILATFAVLSTACQGARLNELREPEIIVGPVQVDRNTLLLELGVQLLYRSECVTLDSTVTGTIDGAPAPKWSAGGEQGSCTFLSCGTSCNFPSFHIPLESADADQVTIAFEDGTTRIAATFLNLGRAPSITVTPPEDGHIRPGSTIGLTYAPSTDDLSQSHWILEGLASHQVDLSQRQGASIQYTIPTTQPAGPATISDLLGRRPGVAACEGAISCSAGIAVGPGNEQPELKQASVTFTIEP